MIDINRLTIRYGTREVIKDVDLHVESGEFVTLLGPSGCGKSTLLRSIAGFVPASGGTITIDGRDVTKLEPEDRGIGFVFQNYALFPHLSMAKNVAFGLGTRGISKHEVASRVDEVLETTSLRDYAKALPAELSGGQQQRVAIARVLVTRPSVLLMDEPLSNLDAALRTKLRAEIARLHRDLNITIIYVTHDQEEALALSDLIAVMRDGRIDQLASPSTLYGAPTNSYVCNFVGSANMLTPTGAQAFGLTQPAQGVAHVRPERVQVGASATTALSAPAVVEEAVYLGARTEYVVKVADSTLTVAAASDPSHAWKPGDQVTCGFAPTDVIWLES